MMVLTGTGMSSDGESSTTDIQTGMNTTDGGTSGPGGPDLDDLRDQLDDLGPGGEVVVMVSIVSTVRDIQRLREILTVLVRHGFGEVVQRTGLGRLAVRATDTDSTDDIVEAEALVAPDAPPLKRIGPPLTQEEARKRDLCEKMFYEVRAMLEKDFGKGGRTLGTPAWMRRWRRAGWLCLSMRRISA